MYFRDRLQLIFYLTYTCIIYVSDKRDTAHCLFDGFFLFLVMHGNPVVTILEWLML